MVVDGKIIEKITNKAVKNAIAEMEQVKPKTVITTLGELIPTLAEIDKDRTIDFYIKVDDSEISYEWKDLINKAIETGKLAHEESKRYGWTWSNAGVDILPRLRVIINSDWKISTGLEVYYQDKEKDYMFGTVYFHINITDDVALKEIIVDAIRNKLFQ